MKIGVFLLIEPFASVEVQLQRAKSMGFDCADITDTNSGGSMLATAGFSPTVSLDDNPFEVKRLFEQYGIQPSTVCAHAGLLEPSNPATYATAEIMKAIRFAAAIGIRDVVTTDMDPKSTWAKNLSYAEQVFVVAEKLVAPVAMAADYGVRVLLEPHGPVTGSIRGLQDVMDRLGSPESLGINLDTGNAWLGGADPVEMATVLKDKIHHVHWKDLDEQWESKRGTVFGCGFSTIALGDGVIDIKGVCDVLKNRDIKSSTLEIIGDEDMLRRSVEYLHECGVKSSATAPAPV
ncbi:sugar phosphate isomerase/epimerase family protein [Rhodopirellula sallentina]|uniref:Xylose isomerase domain protein TIM barrel n=1 Tax=Rhodopirellula sallentina SM41 TaxID=1263870 RepID=M5UP40_9BACT|nr:sugar phosphate isomerase/epimerase family protein [Rhodopirellula sallentina]EMI57763.1 Xylose isomerase domain protein TIM barrel [Rhodopirellula sallentina SM41]